MSNLYAAAQALRDKTNQQNNPQNFATPGYAANVAANNAANVYQPPINRNATMAIFQDAIKAKRKAKTMTQRELARKAGMSQGTVTRAEVHGWVSIWTMLRLLDALDAKITIT